MEEEKLSTFNFSEVQSLAEKAEARLDYQRAIKLYREYTHQDLRKAKDAVEPLRKEWGLEK